MGKLTRVSQKVTEGFYVVLFYAISKMTIGDIFNVLLVFT